MIRKGYISRNPPEKDYSWNALLPTVFILSNDNPLLAVQRKDLDE